MAQLCFQAPSFPQAVPTSIPCENGSRFFPIRLFSQALLVVFSSNHMVVLVGQSTL